MSSKIFVVSGPSGSGKTTLAHRLLTDKILKKRLTKTISLTTRKKRSGETHARDYFFLSPSEFRTQLRQKKILEWTKYLGYYYATPKGFVDSALKAGKSIVLCLDYKGAVSLKKAYPKQTVTIFINVLDLADLRRRIEGRCAKTKKAEICKRLKIAEKEVQQAHKYDYCLVNQDLAKAVRELRSIIVKEIRN